MKSLGFMFVGISAVLLVIGQLDFSASVEKRSKEMEINFSTRYCVENCK